MYLISSEKWHAISTLHNSDHHDTLLTDRNNITTIKDDKNAIS